VYEVWNRNLIRTLIANERNSSVLCWRILESLVSCGW